MKTALVTGGSRGIGLGIAQELLRAGWTVAVMATREKMCYPESVEKLDSCGGAYFWFTGDVMSSDDRRRVFAEAAEAMGEVRLLVNNAGIAPPVRCDLLDLTEEDYDTVLDTNTKGCMFMSQLAARHMQTLEAEGGRRGTIVNISSMSAHVVSVDRGAYCVSKAGISMLTKLFARRLAPDGIYVYEVRPGVIATDMTKKVEGKYSDLIGKGLFPIARWGMPEDIAKAVRMFAEGALPYSTGTVIDVDGGFHLTSL